MPISPLEASRPINEQITVEMLRDDAPAGLVR
jgi:hypothetical protein